MTLQKITQHWMTSCNIVVGCSQHYCVPTCSKAFPSRLTKKRMPSNSCNSFANCNDKISSGFSSPLPCPSVFDFRQNYWINLAHSAIPKEPSLKFMWSRPRRILSQALESTARAPIQRANAEDHLEPPQSWQRISSGKPEKSSYKIINSCRRQTEGWKKIKSSRAAYLAYWSNYWQCLDHLYLETKWIVQ